MAELGWMAEAFREHGLTVREVKDWKTRGRPGIFGPRGVIFHHTASSANSGEAPSLRTCVHGRPGINGPLCNVMIGRDSTVFLVAAGKANHAGKGGPFRNIPRDSANAFTVGVEVENSGTGEEWSPQLLHTCDVVFAALLLGLRRSPSWLIGHKEWAAGRKIDPHPLNMDHRRAEVAHQIKAQVEKAGAAAATKTHVVVKGDTLFAIARANRLSVEELMRLNNLDGTLIKPGQRLLVSRP